MTFPRQVAILGGTGREGRGLARRWAAAGITVVIGSRDAARAGETAAAIPTGKVSGATNADAAARADVVVLTTPWEGTVEMLLGSAMDLVDKLIVSAVVPMRFEARQMIYEPPPEGSVAAAIAAALPRSRVAAAFHTVGSRTLAGDAADLDEDVLVAAEEDADRDLVSALCVAAGGRPVVVGGLAAAGFLEGLTPLLVGINRLHKTDAGIRITKL
ncbi:MAG: NADPH-dependent F420 reductase [Candidatus Dormibacteria bacterium]